MSTTSKSFILSNRKVNRPTPYADVYALVERIDEWYSWDVDDVALLDETLEDVIKAETIRDWSFIVGDVVNYGGSGHNTKLRSNVAIMNLNSATDCSNRNTERCQVPDGECYAYKGETRNENEMGGPLSSRRRQQVVWDLLDAETFFEAYKLHYERKRNEVDFFRWSQSGDFRNRSDVIKVEYISRRLKEECDIQAYTYSASSHIDWAERESFVLNQSNADVPGDRRFSAVIDRDDIPEDGMLCAYDRTDGEVGCGDCTACMSDNAPDVYIELH